MQLAIIASKQDPAGINIMEELKKEKLPDYVSLHEVEKSSIDNEDIDKEIEADLFIFTTKHQSAAGTHSLSCHSPGNWDKAEAGGKDKKLCIAPALLLKEAFLELNKQGQKLNHEITLECTHHGPLINKPIMFIEIGSDKENWRNKEAGKLIASIVTRLVKDIDKIQKKEYEVALGIGGPHYCSAFNKIIQRTNIALGHICPKYMLEKLDKELIQQAIERTTPKPKFVLLDWKGLGKEKARIVKILEELNIDYKRTDQLLKKEEKDLKE